MLIDPHGHLKSCRHYASTSMWILYTVRPTENCSIKDSQIFIFKQLLTQKFIKVQSLKSAEKINTGLSFVKKKQHVHLYL